MVTFKSSPVPYANSIHNMMSHTRPDQNYISTHSSRNDLGMIPSEPRDTSKNWQFFHRNKMSQKKKFSIIYSNLS